MRYYVLDRGDQLSIDLSQQFHKLAKERGLQLDAESPEIVVSIGGDGTMLHAFHTFIDRIPELAFVGVHTGHLGFYADWKAEELSTLVDYMCGKADHLPHKPRIVKYPLLELEIHKKSGTSSHIALNEFTLKGVDGTVVLQIDINDETFEMFRGDGICISTPSGSTAYKASEARWSIPPLKLSRSRRLRRLTIGCSARWVPRCFCPSITIATFSPAGNRN